MNQKIAFPIKNISSEQMEELLFLAEQSARHYILDQIPSKEIKSLDISIEFDTTNELKLDCIIDIQLIKRSKFNPQKITDEAAQKLFEFIEQKLKLESH